MEKILIVWIYNEVTQLFRIDADESDAVFLKSIHNTKLDTVSTRLTSLLLKAECLYDSTSTVGQDDEGDPVRLMNATVTIVVIHGWK